MMRHFIATSVALLWACGGTVAGEADLDAEAAIELPEPGRPYTLLETYPEPLFVESVEFEGQTIEFRAMPEDQGGGVQVQRSVIVGRRDVYDRLMEASGDIVTPAELWTLATGRSDVPLALELDHEEKVARYERRAQRLELPELRAMLGEGASESLAQAPLVQKLTEPDPLGPRVWPNSLVISTTYPVMGSNRCWRDVAQGRTAPNAGTQRRACTGLGNPASLVQAGLPTSSTSCSDTRNVQGWVRYAVYNDSATCVPANGQVIACSGVGSFNTLGGWTCGAFVTFPVTTFVLSDWDTPSMHTAGVGTNNVPGAGSCLYQYVFAIGRLVTGSTLLGTNPFCSG